MSDRYGIPMAAYDEALAIELRGLPSPTRAAFAAACAERLFPAYIALARETGTGDSDRVRAALDVAWDTSQAGMTGPPTPGVAERCDAAARGCTELLSDEPAAIARQADLAIAAVIYALQAAADTDPDAAANAARQVTDALDDHLLRSEIDATDPEADRLVWEHPLVVQEVTRRASDLDQLARADDWPAVVAELRARAASGAALELVSGDP
jgi:hypothetical protein